MSLFLPPNKMNGIFATRYRLARPILQINSEQKYFQAVMKMNPEVMIDSMGYSFTYPLFVLVGCRVGCYIHYPTISTDMLKKVENRNKSFNNRSIIANNYVLSKGKLFYYHFFSWVYGICGRCATSVMTNSSWTKGHLDQLWKLDTSKIFPP